MVGMKQFLKTQEMSLWRQSKNISLLLMERACSRSSLAMKMQHSSLRFSCKEEPLLYLFPMLSAGLCDTIAFHRTMLRTHRISNSTNAIRKGQNRNHFQESSLSCSQKQRRSSIMPLLLLFITPSSSKYSIWLLNFLPKNSQRPSKE